MNPKFMMRKKAVDQLVKESKPMSIKPRKPMMQEGAPQEEMQDGGESEQEEGDPQEGYEQFMVSPQEKELILNMRKGLMSGAGPAPAESDEM